MEGPLSCNISTPTAVKVPGYNSWVHYSQIKLWKETEEDTQNTYELWDISDTHSGLQMSAIRMNTMKIKISQDSSKEPTQVFRGYTPK